MIEHSFIYLYIYSIIVLSYQRVVMFFFFFFQAEDGIRDLTVTGVQTCALPISNSLNKLIEIGWNIFYPGEIFGLNLNYGINVLTNEFRGDRLADALDDNLRLDNVIWTKTSFCAGKTETFQSTGADEHALQST